MFNKKEYFKQYRLKNKDKIKENLLKNKDRSKEYNKQYNLINKEKLNEQSRKYYQDNIESEKERAKIYSKTHRTEINSRDRNKKKTNPLFKLRHSVRRNLWNILKRNRSKRSLEILGCSFEYFKTYIESKFEPWMTWEIHGLYNGNPKYGFDIDHIIPLATAKTAEDLEKLSHYTNLAPLDSYINRVIKRDKLDYNF